MAQITDPEVLLQHWLSEAQAAGETLPEAMALATTRPDGSPSVRMVLMRGSGSDLMFFTDCESQKGDDLRHDARAALLFHWHLPLHRQIRISGVTRRVSDAEADHYWLKRTPAARRTATASHQSQVIDDLAIVDRLTTELERLHGDDIERPQRWGGYRLRPQIVEFWQEGGNRLHDRLRYRLIGTDWKYERLSP
jgi:pyridoxamine 5'-phosphate oxidase